MMNGGVMEVTLLVIMSGNIIARLLRLSELSLCVLCEQLQDKMDLPLSYKHKWKLFNNLLAAAVCLKILWL